MVSEKVRRENADKRKKNKDGVTVTTMHKAKGREWKVVFILGANDNVIPGRQVITKEDLEEERRILYVAMTRAKDELYIGSTAEPSRFIVQTIKGLKEKYTPTIKKKLAGAPVLHKDYGKGKVVGYTQDRIAVMFEGTVRKFVFPDAFKQGQLEYL
jgi:DNA helicase-2/ATP-dependent DNA helicase PcrA